MLILSSSILHLLLQDFLLLCRIDSLYDAFDYVQRHPWKKGYCKYFHEKAPCHLRRIEVGTQKSNAGNIAAESEDRRNNHLPIQFIDLFKVKLDKSRHTSEKTFRSSVITRAVKVIVTMLVKGSLKKNKAESMITQPWNIDFHTHIKKVLEERERPFYKVW